MAVSLTTPGMWPSDSGPGTQSWVVTGTGVGFHAL